MRDFVIIFDIFDIESNNIMTFCFKNQRYICV